jgi:hypothetical protein
MPLYPRGMTPNTRLLLRPSPRRALPLIFLVVLADTVAVGLAAGFLAVGIWGAAAVMLAAGLITGSITWAYFTHASLSVDGDVVSKTNALGIISACRIDDLVGMEIHYSPQPTVRFVRRDGSLAFRVNARLWSSVQMDALRGALHL